MTTKTRAMMIRQLFQNADSTELTASRTSGCHSNRLVNRSPAAGWRSWTVRSFAVFMAVAVMTGPDAFAQTDGGGRDRGTGGGGDIVVFDIIGVAAAASRPTGGDGGGGGDIIIFDIVDSVSDARSAFWCVVVKGDEVLLGILELDGQIVCSESGDTAAVGGLLWLEDGGPVPLLIRMQILL